MTDVNSCVSVLIKEKRRRKKMQILSVIFRFDEFVYFYSDLVVVVFFPFYMFFISVTQSPKISHVEIPKEINFPSFS